MSCFYPTQLLSDPVAVLITQYLTQPLEEFYQQAIAFFGFELDRNKLLELQKILKDQPNSRERLDRL